MLIGDIEVPKEEGVTVNKFGKIEEKNLMSSKPSVTEKEELDFLQC